MTKPLHRSIRCVRGLWWLPRRSRRRVPGVLAFNPHGAAMELSLAGHLLPVQAAIRTSRVAIILGSTTRGRRITLEGCYGPSLHGKNESYTILRAYLGHHFPNERRLAFREARFHCANLTEWVTTSPWYHRTRIRHHPTSSRTLRWSRPSELLANTSLGRVALVTDARVRVTAQRDARLTTQLWIKVVLKRPQPFDSWHSLVFRPITNLINLGTAEMTPLRAVRFLLPRRVVVNQRTVVVKTPVRVFSTQGEDSQRGWRASPVSMPFALALIERRFETVLDRWLRLYEQLRFPLELFFAVHNSPSGLLEYRFLSLVQAAESYHRERVRSEELTQKEFTKRLAILRSCTPKRYRPWLNERLHNRMSLRDRLDALIARTGPTFHALVPDQKKVVDAIVKARNGLSHGQLGFRSAFEGDYGLFRLIEVVSLLLQEQLLRELGFSRVQAGAALERNWKYAYAKRLVPKINA